MKANVVVAADKVVVVSNSDVVWSGVVKRRPSFLPRRRVSVQTTGPSLTKQAMRDECDVNLILKKYQATGVITHVKEAQAQYGDFSDIIDYQGALNQVLRASQTFLALPSRVRDRFQNDPGKFLAFCHDPKNQTEMVNLGLATAKIVDDLKSKSVKDSSEKKESGPTKTVKDS